MSVKVGDLFGELDLRTEKFDSAMDRKKGILGSLTGVAKKAAIGVGAALVGAAVAGTMQFADFDKGMREVFTLLPDITGKQMSKMTGQVKDFAVEFGVLPKEVVPALYQSLSAGVPKENVFKFLEVAQKAAKGGVTDLTTAVDGISSVVNAYGKDVIGAAKASDLMFTAVKGGKTTFGELSSSLFNVIPTASALGVEFGNVTAAIASMTAQGTPTSVATTQMRQMLVELSKAGTKTSDTFKEIAGVGFKDFIAGGGNLQEALQMLEKHANDTGVGINDLFGSVEAGSAALTLTGKGTEKFRAELEAAAGSAGATDAAFKTMSGGLADAFDKLKAAGSVLLITFGELLAPAIMALANMVLTVMPQIQAAVSGAFAVIGPVFEGFGAALSALMSGDVASFAAGISSIFGGGGDVSKNVSGMAAAVQPIIEQVGAFISKIWTDIQSFTKKVWPDIQRVVQKAIEMVKEIIERVTAISAAIWNRWGDNLLRLVTTAWNLIKSVIEAALKVISGIIDVITGIMKGDWDRVWTGIKKILAGVWDAMVALVKAAVGVVHNVITAAWDLVRAATNTAWQRVKDVVRGAWSDLKSEVTTAVGTVKSAISNGWNAAREATGNAWDRIKEAVRNGVESVISFIKQLPGKIVGAIGNLGGLLYDAGRSLITGLLNGIREGLNAVWAEVSSIAGKIKGLKGPISKDRVLLRPEGQAIMQGLVAGLAAEEAALTRKLKDITGTISNLGGSGAMSVGARLAPSIGASTAAAGTGVTTVQNVYHVERVELPNIRGAVQAEEFFGSISQLVKQGV